MKNKAGILSSKKVCSALLVGYLAFPIVASALIGSQSILYFAPLLAPWIAVFGWLAYRFFIFFSATRLLSLLAFDALLIGTAFMFVKNKGKTERLAIILAYMLLSEILYLAFSSSFKGIS